MASFLQDDKGKFDESHCFLHEFRQGEHPAAPEHFDYPNLRDMHNLFSRLSITAVLPICKKRLFVTFKFSVICQSNN